MAKEIQHTGVVAEVEGNTVYVKITSHSACGSCKARQACGLAETQEKIISVQTSQSAMFASGDVVSVGVRQYVGMLSVLLAYVGALLILMVSLVTTIIGLNWSEGFAAVTAVVAVLFYYFILWLFRRKIEHTIQFTITKI